MESGQRLENVDRTHLVVARGKLVPQKIGKSIVLDEKNQSSDQWDPDSIEWAKK